LGRTSAPHVWAAGDCASFPHGEGLARLESVGHAIDQAEAVARNIMGAAQPYVPQPWFWSDQYDAKLQIAGLNAGYDRVHVRDAAGARSHWYYAGDRLLAVDALNDPPRLHGRQAPHRGRPLPAAEQVTDPAQDLKALLRA
jgi:3-phenylpropionate/trans-cinnamate dioxygenase ferredoxin reductase subunit